MSNRKKELYLKAFEAIKELLSQNNIYELNVETIIKVTESTMILAIADCFPDIKRIGCWFHLKKNLEKEARLNLIGKNNKNFNENGTYTLINELGSLPLFYGGNMNYFDIKIEIYKKQFPNYNSFLFKTKEVFS